MELVSEDVKFHVSVVWLVLAPSAIPEVMVVFGAVASMEKVRLAVVYSPPLSRARTVKV